MLSERRLLSLLPGVALLLIPAALAAPPDQYSGGVRTRSLIASSIDESRLISLAGNTHPSANAANDRGAVPDTFPLDHLWLQLQRPPELEKELVDLIDEMNRPGSPQFHNWLTAAEFGRRYGVSRQDAEKVTGWLRSHGFTVHSILPSGMIVDFSGTAAQVRAAFHTEMHNLDVNGERHIANMSDPRIPLALSGVVQGVVSLHNFMPQPKLMPKLMPKFDVSIGGTTFQAVAPPDLATIYNLNPLFTSGITGKNQTIVVIEDTNILNASDVSTFRNAFGLSAYSGTFSQINPAGAATCNNPGVNGAEEEAALDAEWAAAAAPDAAIVLASCADTTTVFGGLVALQNLIGGASPPKIVSISYGECEAANTTAGNATYVSAYQQAAALGISVFVSAGDEGAASCDANKTVATHGIAVSGFASTPYNVAVGGTDFMDTYNSLTGGLPTSTYWSGTNGTSLASALSYIPETPWNDSCASALVYTIEGFTAGYGTAGFCNSATGKASFRTIAAGSGGPSSYSSQPSWQTAVVGLPTAAGGPRYLPDVSLFAANGLWNHFFVFCMSDAAEGGVTCDYTNSTDVGSLAAGGTSFSSPILAGIMALVNQKTGTSQGNPNPRFYRMASAEYGATGSAICNSSNGAAVDKSCVFYDVTQGDIDVNCTGANCFGATGTGWNAKQGVLSTSGSTLSTAYPAGTGWDYATGLGTINAANLVNGWVPAATTTTLTSGTSTSTTGTPVTFTATVTTSNGINIGGSVSWSSNTGCATSPVPTPTAASAVVTCTTSSLPAGTDTVIGTYSGDATHVTSPGSFQEQVNPPVAPTVTFTGAPAVAAYQATFAVSSHTNASTAASILASGACSIVGAAVTMTSGTGTCSLTANWAADANYTSAAATQSTTALKATPAVTFTGAPATAAYQSTFPVSSHTNASTAASYLASGACSIGGTTVTMTSGTGACSLTASWAADSNYNSSSSSQSTGGVRLTPTVSWSTPASIVYGSALGNGQLNATASVAGAFAYAPGAGTVLPVGAGEALAVSFTPADTNDYNSATGSTTITVTAPATTPVNLVVTGTMTRLNGTISVQVTVANSGGTSAANVVLTSVKVGTTAAATLPQNLGALAPGNSAQATVSVPGSAGVSGAAGTLTVAGTYTGGTFTSTARITLP